MSELIAAMVVLAVLACLRETRPGLAHEAKGQPDFPGRSTALTETAKRFCGFARSRGRHADSGFAVSRELGVNSPFLSSNACAMAGDLLLENAVDASAVAFWRNCDTLPGRRRALVYVARCGEHEAFAECLERQVELETHRRVAEGSP